MPIDPSVYAQRQQAYQSQYSQQRAANEYGRFVGQQRGQRQIADYQADFKRKMPQLTAAYSRRNLSGPGVRSGVYQNAMTNYLGDYTKNLGYMQQDQDIEQQQYAMNESQYQTDLARAMADLEYQKAQDIQNTAANLAALRPYYSGG